MAYTDDAVKAKLAALNETQDSIVTVAQWIMFHRRHADRTAALWLARLQDSSTSKRLNLIYLANEVVQQSRARSKTDFLIAFEPLIGDATALAYKNASVEIQNKIKRVVEVWRQRGIFDKRIQEAAEKRIEEIDKSRSSKGTMGGGKLGGSLFGNGGGNGGGVPPELDGVSKAQSTTTKAELGVRGAVSTANTEYAKMTDPNTPLPTPPVHAARLSALMKSLATAQGAVEASMKSRRELIAGLEKLLEMNRAKIAEEETTAADLATRRQGIEDKKKEVEDGIMRGLSNPASPLSASPSSTFPTNGTNGNSNESSGPEPESFTPPPPDVEAFTPPGEPADEGMGEDTFAIGDNTPAELNLAGPTGAEYISELPPNLEEPAPAFEPPPALATTITADDILSSLHIPQVRQASADEPEESADPRLKRRKISHKPKDADEDIFGAGGAAGGVDDDGVSAMLQ